MAVLNPSYLEHVIQYKIVKAEERRYRQQMPGAAYRVLGKTSFSEGVAGHVTVRTPEYPGHIWVNPMGLGLSFNQNNKVGFPVSGWFNLLPEYQDIVATYPELLD